MSKIVSKVWLAAGISAGMMGLGGLALAKSDNPPSTGGGDQTMSPGSTSKTYKKGTATPKENLRTFSLKVKDVDKAKKTVDFQAKVKPEANIIESGKPIKLDQLNPGDEVRASFDPSTGEVVRLEVIKMAP